VINAQNKCPICQKKLSLNNVHHVYIQFNIIYLFIIIILQRENNVKLKDHILGFLFVDGNFEHEFGGS